MLVITDRGTGSTGAQTVLDVLLDEGVDVAFGYPGGAIMPLYDALYGHRLRHILVRHEAAAAFAAGAYARSTGRVGVCMATSGPGATNLVTGIVDALMDSVPLVAITGQVRTPLLGTDGFQEADVTGITHTITKRNFLVRTAEEIEPTIRAAFRLARGPRPGPVLVDIPQDILRAKVEHSRPAAPRQPNRTTPPTADPVAIARAVEIIAAAQRPLAIVGGGARIADAVDEYREFLALVGMPHTATINGLGCGEQGDPYWLGMLGMHGWKAANKAVIGTDCIIALGMRFDDRVTGRTDKFAVNAKIVHADVDASEFNKIIPIDVALHGDLKATLTALNAALRQAKLPRFDAWAREAAGERSALPTDRAQEGHLSATDVLDAFFAAAPADSVVATDVGQHQMWAAQRCRPQHPRDFLTSAGLGTMGFGLPAAIGAQFAHPDRAAFAICGDGGFQMSISELATLKRYELPVKILLIDNRNLGMVRQWQELFYDARYSATNLSDNPDFVMIAQAYGIESEMISDPSELPGALARFIASPKARLLHCACYPTENCWPMIPAGGAIEDMIDKAPEKAAVAVGAAR